MSKMWTRLILLAVAGLPGCAGSLTAADGQRMRLQSDEFAQYAERVFRLQNEVLDSLTFALDEHADEMSLSAAEDEVLGACAGLNDMAVRRRSGGGQRPLRDLRAARAVPDCEVAAHAAARLLDSLSL